MYYYSRINKLAAENFAASLTQANLAGKTDFDNKLISFNRKITSSKTKYLEVVKKLNSLTTKECNFFLKQNLQVTMDFKTFLFIIHHVIL